MYMPKTSSGEQASGYQKAEGEGKRRQTEVVGVAVGQF